ncbi:MAG TPA: murein biosynthesis integral membrane protein MurJ, partial [Candidatus Saccharimonadales bacterium]|nr:murein biosynthesis integral membrane protein MurJ [Candidatus Saccharimonadales bacterium]
MSRSILKQSSKIGFFALMSRCIAFLREILLIRFLSVGDSSDIFLTAFRIPNTMRKIFAEGSLSSVLVPAMISAEHKNGKDGLNRLTTFSFIIVESVMFFICLIIFFHAEWFIQCIAPGFSPDKIIICAHLLKILISFILFMSSGAIFSSALQSQHRFFMPAIAPSFSNVLYVIALAICLYFKLSIVAFCYSMIVAAFLFFISHVVAYLYDGFSFQTANPTTLIEFKKIVTQFLPCFFSVGIVEINHFINTGFASYLPGGSMTLLRYAYQFVNIPIGIITASLVTVLLPHFSKVHLESPKELAVQLFEAIKFIIWTTLPICFLLGFFSETIFQTLFTGDAAATSKVIIAQSIFIAYLIGLLFFSLNKVFLTIFYALRLTYIPVISTFISIAINIILNQLLMKNYGITGIAFSSSVAAIAQTIFFIFFLHVYLKLSWPKTESLTFLKRCVVQLAFCCAIFYIVYRVFYSVISHMHFTVDLYFMSVNQTFFLDQIGSWIWTGPLCLLFLGLLYVTKKSFGIKLAYF